MVEIFRTNVKSKRLAGKILKVLQANLPAFYFNFDLDDCDRILRVQSNDMPVECRRIMQIVQGHEIEISLFED
ncbi:MAG TPA: methyltransferase type 11 [Mucilaginibacter sp.]